MDKCRKCGTAISGGGYCEECYMELFTVPLKAENEPKLDHIRMEPIVKMEGRPKFYCSIHPDTRLNVVYPPNSVNFLTCPKCNREFNIP